ncbi:alpha/beta fold hydrolase [Kitasatospora sp. NPDC002227]|uniref:alpha/beta fold hydrolase n=1 Tax=Kitasatospora sp. NPDC002227 TaxID=3154773 RepID=UPI003329A261
MPETLAQPRPLARIVRGTGPGLVLAHGGGGGAELNWGTFILPLAERHTVIAPDFPGSGRTPAEPGELRLDDLADRLVAAAVEEGQTRFDLVGFSLGAAVAVRAARRHPGLVRSLTLVAGLAHTTPHLRLLTDCLLTAQRLDPLLQAKLTLPLLLSPDWLNTQADADLVALAKLMLVTTPPGFRQQFELAAEVDVRPDLPHLTMPTLVVSPTADALVAPAQHRLLAATVPGAELLELPSGHLVLTERRAELLTALRAFLARQN